MIQSNSCNGVAGFALASPNFGLALIVMTTILAVTTLAPVIVAMVST